MLWGIIIRAQQPDKKNIHKLIVGKELTEVLT